MARPAFPRSILEFQEQFGTEEACWQFLFDSRWPDGFSCPRCQGDGYWARTSRPLAAAQEVLSTGTAFGLPTRHEVSMAEALIQRMPHLDHWRFANSGTEAVMQALWIARVATGRDVIRFRGSYHGVKGQWDFPVGGQQISLLVDSSSPCPRTTDLLCPSRLVSSTRSPLGPR